MSKLSIDATSGSKTAPFSRRSWTEVGCLALTAVRRAVVWGLVPSSWGRKRSLNSMAFSLICQKITINIIDYCNIVYYGCDGREAP